MKIYFIKAQFTNNVYKISDFYSTPSVYNINENRQFDINFKADDASAVAILPSDKLPDNTDVRDYTHIIVKDMNKIYEIISFQYLNQKQPTLILSEDPFIANYYDFYSSSTNIVRSNDPLNFNGLHDVRDVAIEHNSNVINTSVKEGTPEILVAYTFQNDAEPVFTLKDLDDFPEVDGTFSTINELRSAYPDVNTYVPTSVDYFLKFKRLTNGVLYQAVFIESAVEWVKVKDKLIVFNGRTGTTTYDKKFNKTNKYGYVRTQIGDIGTKTFLFTMDASIYQRVNFIGKFGTASPQTMYDNLWQLPNYYSIESFTDSDKLLSVKLISTSMINIDFSLSEEPVTESMNTGEGGIANWQTVMSNDDYLVKTIENTSIFIEVDNNVYATNDQGQAFLPPSMSLSIINFKENINIHKPINSSPTIFDYEPFKKYFLFVYGEMVEIPAKYAFSDLKMRLAYTSQEMMFEIYNTKHNVIASGRLNLNMRWKVDQLDQFYANNPTYKDQWMMNQLMSTGDALFGGAMSGGAVGGIHGAAIGAGAGLLSSAMNFGASYADRMFMEKGLKDKADQVYGVNGVAMTWIKGFGLYWVIITPDNISKTMMENTYLTTGHPTNIFSSIASVVNAPTIFGQGKIIRGRLSSVIKNMYVTGYINAKLSEGVIIV